MIKKYKGRKSSLLAVLQDIQKRYNWLSPDSLKMVSQELSIPLIDVFSAATFYSAFNLTPRGKHTVTVCLGTACYVGGAQTILNRLEERLKIESGNTTPDGQFTLETVNCLGACALAPIVVVNGRYHGKSTIKEVDSIIDDCQCKSSEKTAQKEKSR